MTSVHRIVLLEAALTAALVLGAVGLIAHWIVGLTVLSAATALMTGGIAFSAYLLIAHAEGHQIGSSGQEPTC